MWFPTGMVRVNGTSTSITNKSAMHKFSTARFMLVFKSFLVIVMVIITNVLHINPLTKPATFTNEDTTTASRDIKTLSSDVKLILWGSLNEEDIIFVSFHNPHQTRYFTKYLTPNKVFCIINIVSSRIVGNDIWQTQTLIVW